jgi:hypothetical protein
MDMMEEFPREAARYFIMTREGAEGKRKIWILLGYHNLLGMRNLRR